MTICNILSKSQYINEQELTELTSANNMKQSFVWIILLFVSCSGKKLKMEPENRNDSTFASKKPDSDSMRIKSRLKLRDSLLADPKLHPIVKYYIQDTSAAVPIEQVNDSVQYKILGDINGDGKPDSVFLMPEFLYVDSTRTFGDFGHSFTFTNRSLSRIQKDEGCNQLDNLFAIEDIDEDGIKELGLYISSCSSHYKALSVYSLKKNQWREVGTVTFDLLYDKPPREKRIKKISKGKFAMREISDLGITDHYHDTWVQFEIK